MSKAKCYWPFSPQWSLSCFDWSRFRSEVHSVFLLLFSDAFVISCYLFTYISVDFIQSFLQYPFLSTISTKTLYVTNITRHPRLAADGRIELLSAVTLSKHASLSQADCIPKRTLECSGLSDIFIWVRWVLSFNPLSFYELFYWNARFKREEIVPFCWINWFRVFSVLAHPLFLLPSRN